MPDFGTLLAGGRAHGHDHEHDHGHGHHHADRPALAGGRASTGQVIAFGFSGGLMPCPAALAALALCLSAGAVGVGMATVAAFSAGPPAVLVGVGLLAAWTSAPRPHPPSQPSPRACPGFRSP